MHRSAKVGTMKIYVPISCPVPGWVGRAGSRDGLRMHFCHRHPFDTIVIVEKGRLPKSRAHRDSKRCQASNLRKRKRQLEICQLQALESTGFHVASSTLENVETFLYLERVVTATVQDWPDLCNPRKRWALFKREGAKPRGV